MKALTFPFKTPRDEAAFKLILSFMSPEDQDEMIEAHNRRDPATHMLRAEDRVANARFVRKLLEQMRMTTKEEFQQRAADLGLGAAFGD